MGLPAAKRNDRVTGMDIHIVLVPSPGGPVPTPLPHPFSGPIDRELSSNVEIEGQPAATVGSIASNRPPHTPTPPGTAFQVPPANEGTIRTGSATVQINNKASARAGDLADTCNDVGAPPASPVVVTRSTVLIG